VVTEIEKADDGDPHHGRMEVAGRRSRQETDDGYSSPMGQRLCEGERKLRVGRGVV
jgi:hypothetical protein